MKQGHFRAAMTAKRLAPLCAWWLLLATANSFGQRYPILPVPGSPHSIYTMMQDSRSRIWMGTIDDLFCFDGVHFFSLRGYGYPRETANALAEDTDGGIWIATQGTAANGGTVHGGLYRYQSGHVQKVFSGDGLSVVSGAPGVMLASFGTEAVGRPTYGDLYRFRQSGATWIPELLKEKAANHLTVDKDGTTLFPCPGGWCELPRRQLEQWKGASAPLALHEHAGSPLVERVLRDRFGCVWFRAEAAASYQCPDMKEAAPVPDTISRYDGSAHLEEASDGSVFMLVGLTLGRPGAFHLAATRNGIPPGLTTAMVAKDGTIWLGSDTGLYRFMYPFRLEYWTRDSGLETPSSILRLNNKMFTTTSGIVTLSEDRRSWRPLAGTGPLGLLTTLIAGPKETILAASPQGVAQLRMDGTTLARSDRFETRIPVVALAMSRDSKVWLGAKGIFRLVKRGNRLALHSENVADDDVADLQYDSARDTLWACDGKDLIYRKDGQWRHITAKDGLLDASCRTIAVHPDGNIWLGYETHAFALIRNPASDHVSVVNYTSGLNQVVSNGGTAFLGVDGRGWLWRGSDANYVANPTAAESGEWLRLDQQDGIPAVGANDRTFFSDPDRSVWFAVSDTIVHFSPPDDFATHFPSPPVFVSGFSVGQGAPTLADTMGTVPHGPDLVAHIGSLQFDRRNALHLRYRLLPEQSAWQAERNLDLHLGKLHWGSHTLEVQAALGTGPWSETVRDSFTVLKPLWLTWPALLGFAVAGGVATLGGQRWHAKRKQRSRVTLPDLTEWRLAALSPEAQQFQGAVLDSRFEVGRILARGGFAAVMKGRDLQQDGLTCAIKIFRQELLDKDWMAKRFQQEVLALEQIRHPNVVCIYGHGAAPGGAPYLVMEFVDGKTLRDILAARRLSPSETASYLRQMASALGEIHAHGICHRDLKPENLMIRTTGSPGEELVLIDFSIAIVKDPEQTLQGISRAAGTIYYMAPEQAIGYADASSDIYSLAKIVIEMITGQRLTSLLPQASMDLSARVRELLIELPIKLSASSIDFISTALEFDPLRRPTSVTKFAAPIVTDLETGSNRETGNTNS